MPDKNVERAARLDTATISDAMDKLRISGQCIAYPLSSFAAMPLNAG